jgi:mRNA-degrading endonuclease RelE of RelBE toxin-antitoxin system
MKINWLEEARDDLQRFEEPVRDEIAVRVGQLENNPLGENTSLFSKQGMEIFRLKLKDGQLDHRVFFDLDDGEVLILGVEHRDDAYTPESIKKIKSRL